VLLTVVRPLLRQVFAADAPAKGGGDQSSGGGGMQTLPPGSDPQQMLSGPLGPNESPSERMLALAQIKGHIKAQSVEKIGAMVQKNPGDSVAVIRSWVHDQPANA
jgi:flagellar M-ring protein FliF